MTEPAAPEGQTPAQPGPDEGGQTPQPSGSGQTASQQTPAPNGDGQTARPFDAAYVQSLRNEAKTVRLERDALKAEKEEREQASMSELQKVQRKLDAETQRADASEIALARFQVIAEKEIPLEWQEFLKGETREELESNADKLKELIGGQRPSGAPDFGAGARPNGGLGAEEDFSTTLRRAAGRPA